MAVPLKKLNNGTYCPSFGLGTWLAAPGEAKETIKTAIDIGYRLFDCAWVYGNEKEIGEGLQAKISDGTVTRADLFVVTKLWNVFHEEDKVIPACKESLKNLGLEYIDLYLMHWPCATICKKFDSSLPFKGSENIEYDFCKTWKAMENCVSLGLVKSIGLSNFNSEQVARIMKSCSIKPVMNQIEVTPFLNQKKLITICKDHDIEIMAYSPLASPARPWAKEGDKMLSLEDSKLLSIGKKYRKTTAQVVLRYVYQQGTIPIPKSSNPDRLKQNIDIFDFILSEEDLKLIDIFNCGTRICHAEELKDNSEYPFNLVE
ncbi:aldo-keto reductase family 1 member B1-like [Diorhabda carinulata]|uniref:aldo-keto reductase family 1 member B1-like n=1 Tax=Diorhabda carinulata TaxID=1163345 RepID=UPI0025A00C34|nr:aldo-keto reductase family 1 member B1-like [Diorhabda carinulata]XP_057668056.1 aldo-keto reductase family 1 member B1-like [Diorhabda carinulata]